MGKLGTLTILILSFMESKYGLPRDEKQTN